MKKKALAVLLCVMALTALITSSAQAGWFTCSISQAAYYNGGLYVVSLTDTNTAAPGWVGDQLFLLNTADPNVKSMYATALTAFANSAHVLAWVNTTTPYSTVFNIGAANN